MAHEPIEEQHRQLMNRIARALDDAFNPDRDEIGQRRIGFALLVYPFDGAPGRCNYISNGASRKDMAALFREQAAYFEGQSDGQEGTA